MITISILPNGAVSIYHDGKPVELPTKEDFRAPPKNVAVSGDDIPGRLANLLRDFPQATLTAVLADRLPTPHKLGPVKDVYGNANNIDLFVDTEKENFVQCTFCPNEAPRDDAPAHGWVASYWVSRQKHGSRHFRERFLPVCPTCAPKFLSLNANRACRPLLWLPEPRNQ